MKDFTISENIKSHYQWDLYLQIRKLKVLIFFIAFLFINSIVYSQVIEKNKFIDGNAIEETVGSTTYFDWESLIKDNGVPTNSVYSGLVFDDLFDPSRTVDKTFTQGSKDHDNIPDWTNTNNGPNDKTDIQQAAAFLYDGVIYFTGTLYAANGDANIGLWFLQYENPDTGEGVRVNGTKFTGEHVVGDLFVVAAFSGGGKIDNIAVYEWVGKNNGGDLPNSSKTLKILIPPNVINTPYSPYITAIVNTAPTEAPWEYHTKGTTGAVSNFPALTFFEGYIDLKGLLNDPNLEFTLAGGSACFSSFFMNTRNSTSVDAALNDFANGEFDVRPDVELEGFTVCEGDDQGILEPTIKGGLFIPGTTDFEYKWYKGGVEIPPSDGGTGSTYLVDEEAGTYTFKVEVTGDAIDGLGICIGEAETTVTIIKNPDFEVKDLASCEETDENGDDTGSAFFDLTSAIDQTGEGPDDGTFSYYDENPESGTPTALTQLEYEDYEVDITGDTPLTIWVVLDNDNDNDNDPDSEDDLGCRTIKTFQIEVYDNPDFEVQDLASCEEAETGSADFDLEDGIDMSGYDPDAGTFSFYDEDPSIGTPTALTQGEIDVYSVNITDGTPVTIWVVLDNDNDPDSEDDLGCRTIKTFEIEVYDNPDFDLVDLASCEEVDENGDDTGSASFDLSDAIDQTGDGPDAGTFTYYDQDPDSEGAIALSLVDYSDYSVSITGDTPKKIWVVLDNDNDPNSEDDLGCRTIQTFEIEVYNNPDVQILERPSDPICDQDLTPENGQGDPTPIQFKANVNGAAWLGDTGTLTGVWSGDVNADGTYNPNISESLNKEVTFTVTDSNGDCVGSDTINITIEEPVLSDPIEEEICITDIAVGGINIRTDYIDPNETGTIVEGSLSFKVNGEDSNGTLIVSETGVYSIIATYYVEELVCPRIASITITVITCIIDEGCTPGFWKNHLEAWEDTGAHPNDDFFDFFGIELGEFADPDFDLGNNVQDIIGDMDQNEDQILTLLEAISAEIKTSHNNGWFAALARHAVAAYLNASYGLNYEFSTGYIIEATRVVFTTDYQNRNAANEAAQELHTMFKTANERICPIGNSKAQEEPLSISTADNTLSSVVVNSFSAYPVPFKESLNIQYDFDYESAAVIQLFDLQGKLLRTYNEANAYKGKVTELHIDFRTRASQVYIVKVTTNRDVFTKKIISDK